MDGEIGALGLGEWWSSALTDEERSRIQSIYSEQMRESTQWDEGGDQTDDGASDEGDNDSLPSLTSGPGGWYASALTLLDELSELLAGDKDDLELSRKVQAAADRLSTQESLEIGGALRYFELTSWWLKELSEGDRAQIIAKVGTRYLRGEVEFSNSSAGSELVSLAEQLGLGSDVARRSLVARLLKKAEELLLDELNGHNSYAPALHLFFAYFTTMRIYYSRIATIEDLELVIQACEKQIALNPRAERAFAQLQPAWWNHMSPGPHHPGYERLAIIRESAHEYAEVIRLCKEAKAQGWSGDWDKRIDRCERRLARSLGTSVAPVPRRSMSIGGVYSAGEVGDEG